MSEELIKALGEVQYNLKAPKGQTNTFGHYNYRSCEDILEAVKPLLHEAGLTLTLSDDVIAVGNRIYVKATATVTNGTDSVSNTAFAREAETKKGMDDSQITGTASSYARKYALNGLFCMMIRGTLTRTSISAERNLNQLRATCAISLSSRWLSVVAVKCRRKPWRSGQGRRLEWPCAATATGSVKQNKRTEEMSNGRKRI